MPSKEDALAVELAFWEAAKDSGSCIELGRGEAIALARVKESYRKAFDALGVDKVRRFADNPSNTGEKLEQALLWIGEKEAEQQRTFMARIEARMGEQTDIARSTKNAARIAALLAAIAAIISIVVLFK